MAELVSILIPAYNAEKWIKDTIQSAVNQTWSNKEIIVVDDGSTDNTREIAERFQSKLIKVVTQENTGACGARNRALRLAQGDFIQWLDADDLLHPEKVARQLNSTADTRTSRTLLTCAWGSFFFRYHKAKFVRNSLWQDLTPVDWIMKKFTDNVWMNPTVWLVSRRLTELAGPWNETLSRSGDDDGEYVCRVVAASDGVKFVPEAKCYYRIGNVGSLDWNMGKSNERLDPLYSSIILSISHLRSLEDTERTRLASLRYLQMWLQFFYPAKAVLLNAVSEVARELGGGLPPPEVSWKYYPIKKIFGWRVARKTQSNWRKVKLIMRKTWDELLFRLIEREHGI